MFIDLEKTRHVIKFLGGSFGRLLRRKKVDVDVIKDMCAGQTICMRIVIGHQVIFHL